MPEHAVEYYTKREKSKLAEGVQSSRVENCYWAIHSLQIDHACSTIFVFSTLVACILKIAEIYSHISLDTLTSPHRRSKGTSDPHLHLPLSLSLSLSLSLCFISEDAKTRRSRFHLLHTQRQLISTASHSFIWLHLLRQTEVRQKTENLFRIAETSRRSIGMRRQ